MARPDIQGELARATNAANLVVSLADADTRISHFTGGKTSTLTDKMAEAKKIATIQLEQSLDDLLKTEEAKTTLAAANKALVEVQAKHDDEARKRASGNVPPSHKPRAAAKVEDKVETSPPAPKNHGKVVARPGQAGDKPGGE